jgi:hypothetical protein
MHEMTMGRAILSGVAVFTAVGGVLADWNRTHLFNPRWTPHAKFHDGWTILLGASLGASSLYLLWKEQPEPGRAALLSALFWSTQAGSFFFPGAAGIASEFPDPSSRPMLAKVDERITSGLMLVLAGIGYATTRRRT